jgi:predicted transcriptional regulator
LKIKKQYEGLSMKDTHTTREARQIKLLADRIRKITKIIKSKKLEPSFEPSMKTLSRIMKVMIENGAEGKTDLSLHTNLNYTRLAKHIVWLEKKGLVKSIIENGKINVVLTTNGKEFASTISKII